LKWNFQTGLAFGQISGWALMALLLVNILLPYWFRKRIDGVAFLKRMRLHFWIGYTLPALIFVHLWIPMVARVLRPEDKWGLYLATAGYGVLILQAIIGSFLRKATGRNYNALLRVHFYVLMIALPLILSHVFLNHR